MKSLRRWSLAPIAAIAFFACNSAMQEGGASSGDCTLPNGEVDKNDGGVALVGSGDAGAVFTILVVDDQSIYAFGQPEFGNVGYIAKFPKSPP